MRKTSDTADKKKLDDTIIAARNTKNLNEVRWYLLIYPYGRKYLTDGLEREVARRKRDGEPPVEYFAPSYVEAKNIDGKIVTTDKPLFENYVFVRASVREIFRMKQYEGQYNFCRRETKANGEQYYPHVTDDAINDLKWIARSYKGVVPVYVDDISWLIKGDRVRIVSGPFKGVEATVFEDAKKNSREIMVTVDSWMTVPLLSVKSNQYKVISLCDTDGMNDIKIGDEVIPSLHAILCRHISGTVTEEDKSFIAKVVADYGSGEVHSDVMRCKLYSILLMAYTILGNADKRESLLGICNVILPVLKAEQSKALLLTTMYGCTDNNLYYRQAHQVVAPWTREASPKPSKKALIARLSDYDKCLNHK